LYDETNADIEDLVQVIEDFDIRCTGVEAQMKQVVKDARKQPVPKISMQSVIRKESTNIAQIQPI
jgi:hypothetical protein